MPKLIKKKAAKQQKQPDDIQTLVSRARESAARQKRRLVSIAIAVLVILGTSGGFYFYTSSVSSRAATLEYEGYKLFFSLYEKQPVVKTARLKAALESFRKANELRESPYSLFYIASCHYSLGDYDGAIAALRELNLKFPDDESYTPLAHYKMAMADMKAGRPEKALKALDALYNYWTASYRDLALIESARLLEEMGRTEEAEKKYFILTKDFPQSPFFEEAFLKLEKEKKG